MLTALVDALKATALVGFSLYLWHVGYQISDWAVLALIPLALILFLGNWKFLIDPWKAKMQIELRDGSPLSRILTGKIRATLLSVAFVTVTIALLAWQTVDVSTQVAALLLLLVYMSGGAFSWSQSVLERHLNQPFARIFATSVGTWLIAVPFTLIMAAWSWTHTVYPGEMLTATFLEALQLGMDKLPARRGWIAELLAVPYAYDGAKLWAVVQLREYPLVGVLFSLDTALFGFILARAGIIVMQFVQSDKRKDAK